MFCSFLATFFSFPRTFPPPQFALSMCIIRGLVCQSFTCRIWNQGLGTCVPPSVAAHCFVLWQDGLEVLWSLVYNMATSLWKRQIWRYKWTSFTHSEDIEYLLSRIIMSKLDHYLFGNKTYFQISSILIFSNIFNPQDLHRPQDKANG